MGQAVICLALIECFFARYKKEIGYEKAECEKREGAEEAAQ